MEETDLGKEERQKGLCSFLFGDLEKARAYFPRRRGNEDKYCAGSVECIVLQKGLFPPCQRKSASVRSDNNNNGS